MCVTKTYNTRESKWLKPRPSMHVSARSQMTCDVHYYLFNLIFARWKKKCDSLWPSHLHQFFFSFNFSKLNFFVRDGDNNQIFTMFGQNYCRRGEKGCPVFANISDFTNTVFCKSIPKDICFVASIAWDSIYYVSFH